MDILKYNSNAWDKEVEIGNKWTLPVDSNEVDKARSGEYSVLLTPTKEVPKSWIGNIKDKDVLCLACGGGQQGPIFSALGGKVTVFDNSKEQLSKDEFVSKRDDLSINLEQGDMRDLSRFDDESFDFIFHPVSNTFIDNIELTWKECYRVLRKGGVLVSGFTNPIMYIFNLEEYGKGNLVVEHTIPYSDIEQLPKEKLEEFIESNTPLEFGHTLQSQIGGQIEAGFLIGGFFEDKVEGDILGKYIDTYMATKAIKL